MLNLILPTSPGYFPSIRALSPIGSEVLTIGGSLISFANVLASASVIYVCLVHPRTDRIAHLCTAIAELVLGVLTIASLVYSMMYDVLIPQAPCTAFGFLVHFTVSIDIVSAMGLVIVTWLKVNHSYRSKTGVYDWKLWATVMSIPLILCCVTVGLGGYGQDIYWCHTQPTTTGATIGLGSLIAINYLALGLVTFFHLSSISKQHQISNLSYTVGMGEMRKNQRRPSSIVEPINILTPHLPLTPNTSLYPPASAIGFELHSPSLVSANVMQPVHRPKNNLNTYIFVHFLQHTTTTVYCICCLSNYQPWWVYFIFIAGFHLGGIGKVILFHRGRDRRPAGSRTTRALDNPPTIRYPTTLSMGLDNPEFRRPAPSWQGAGHNNLSDMWQSSSTLATTNSPLHSLSTDDHPPTIHHINTATPSITNNPAATRQSLYPESTAYVFRHASASFGTSTDSSGSATNSVLATRRNMEVAPLHLSKGSKNNLNHHVQEDSSPEYDDDDFEELDNEAQPGRAERVSLHP
ncbi:hypothetical protein BC943DRAFT_354020 [Umbelopsis sp. AD052]|nr:hypothetical protein BC943DRAFT_354020 [Umbelopsis sp. AD052]